MLRDIEPRYDVKGGNPRTPPRGIPMPVQEYPTPPPTVITNGNGVWKLVGCTAITACLGLVGMYFTAMASRGISQKEMQDYVERYSPYTQDKALIAQQQSTQDAKLGEHTGKLERAFDKFSKQDELNIGVERSISDIYKKVDTITNYLEEEKKVKR